MAGSTSSGGAEREVVGTPKKPSVRVLYEFNLSCGHIAEVEVDAKTYEPLAGVYVCPECGAEERA